MMHEKLDEFNKLQCEPTIKFKNAYNGLLNAIKKYRFKQNSSKGFAINQNKNSQTIMFDLERLNAILDDMLIKLDHILIQNDYKGVTSTEKKKKDPTAAAYLMFPSEVVKQDKSLQAVNSINDSLEMCTKHLNEKSKTLNEAMYTYYDYSKKDIVKNSSVRAREWKKERNNALHTILTVSFVISETLNVVKYILPDINNTEVNERYEKFNDYLSKRPNYYSYLTPYAQKKSTMIGKSLKKQKK